METKTKFIVKTCVNANVELTWEVEASCEAEALKMASNFKGDVLNKSIEWETAETSSVYIPDNDDEDGEWVSPSSEEYSEFLQANGVE